MLTAPRYARVLLKVSGEALMGEDNYGIDVGTVDRIASDVKEAADSGSQICMVIGGGNIFPVLPLTSSIFSPLGLVLMVKPKGR